MNSADRFQPWCIICLQPDLHHHVLTRFQHRPDAEAHLKVLRQIAPQANYMVMFDSPTVANDFYDTYVGSY